MTTSTSAETGSTCNLDEAKWRFPTHLASCHLFLRPLTSVAQRLIVRFLILHISSALFSGACIPINGNRCIAVWKTSKVDLVDTYFLNENSLKRSGVANQHLPNLSIVTIININMLHDTYVYNTNSTICTINCVPPTTLQYINHVWFFSSVQLIKYYVLLKKVSWNDC